MKKDWEIKKLGEVAEYINGRAFKPEEWETKGLPIIRIQNLTNSSDVVNYTTKKYDEKYFIKNGDLLFAWSASLGAYIWKGQDAWLNQHIFKVIPNQNVNKDYLFHALSWVTDILYSKTHGAVMVHVTLKPFLNTEIPVPPLEEQKRIVKILDEKFAQLETIKANAQTNLQNVKDLFQSQLTKAFSNTTWEKKKVSEISENLDSKRIPITKNVRKTGQYPYYGASGIVDYVEDYIFDGKFLLVSEDGANLLARTYPIAFIAEGKFWVNNHAHILSFKDEITMKFVELFFSNLDISPYVTGMAQPKFNQSSLNNIEIPLPPLPEQKRIVKELDTLSEKVRQLQEIYTKQIANCAELKQSLLQKAFEGEL